MKICKQCEVVKECKNDFYFRKDNGKYRNECKDCWNKRCQLNPKRKLNNDNFLQRNILYQVWANMIQRCDNPNRPDYGRYGGRGIKFCKKWMNYKNFEKDMFPTYKKGLTLDRIDNNGNYNKQNCKWATAKEQALNRRNNHFFEYNSMKKTLTDWALFRGIKRSTLSMRIYCYHWPLKKALNYNINQ